MKNLWAFKTTKKCSAMLAIGLCGFGPVLVQAEALPGEPAIYTRDAVVYGKTYGEWSAAWQQWADSIPAVPSTAHPLFDNPDCSVGQSGPVWFLGGKFCSSEAGTSCTPGEATRLCTIPFGTALYFPVVNYACLSKEAELDQCAGVGPSITEIRAALSVGIDTAFGLEVTVDGKRVKGDIKKDFRVQSPVYTAVVPENNLFTAIGEGTGDPPVFPAGTYWGIDEGVYIMLKPLQPGQHVVRFKGSFPFFSLDITYNLSVVQ